MDNPGNLIAIFVFRVKASVSKQTNEDEEEGGRCCLGSQVTVVLWLSLGEGKSQKNKRAEFDTNIWMQHDAKFKAQLQRFSIVFFMISRNLHF